MKKQTMTLTKAQRYAAKLESYDLEGLAEALEVAAEEAEELRAGFLQAMAHALKEGWDLVDLVTVTEDDGDTALYLAPSTGVMVGWFLDQWQAEELEVEGGVEDLHMTVLFLGDADDLSLDQYRTLIGVVSEVVSVTPALYGVIDGTGTFEQEDGTRVWWAEPKLVGLEEFRDRLKAALEDAGIPVPERFPTFQPHITLAYLEPGQEVPAVELPETEPMIVREITVALGAARHTLTFAELNREEYEAWEKDRYGDTLADWPTYRRSRFIPLVKSVVAAEKRFTLGPWYIPDEVDAHGEWTDADELQDALWRYVDSGYRTIHLQHSPEIPAGRWVEIMALPFAIELPVIDVNGVVAAHSYPAGTVLMGVIWEPWAWELVKEGKITGYSIGGSAARSDEDPPEGDGVSPSEDDD